jgi:hypothetical protein
MKINSNNGVPTPQAHVAINKGRLKVYNRNSNSPTLYLQKGQEFQLELFNPTSHTVLAKIFLNGNAISQGGLVLRPGERVFLDRYIDVPKKFLFDTYDVENTSEVKKAIEDNGDFKVEFYKEHIPTYNISVTPSIHTYINQNNDMWCGNIGTNYKDTIYGDTSYNINALLNSTSSLNDSLSLYSTTSFSDNSLDLPNKTRSFAKKSKSIETGRVEKGSTSDQKLTTVNMSWEYLPFHTVEYKLLPVSQKINTTDDINIKRYCTNCGSKLGKSHNFCANCGSKA